REIRANGAGAYTFSGLAAGTYSIRSEQASGWTQTYPANAGANVVTVGSGQALSNVNFGVVQGTPAPQKGSISGTYFYDGNGNGVWDAGETTSPYWLVYIDSNNNGVQDSNETEVRANGAGVYTFSGLAAGTYHIRSEQASGWTQTYPANASAQTVVLDSGVNASKVNFGVVKGTPTAPPTSSI